jgi:hypothetical protein
MRTLGGLFFAVLFAGGLSAQYRGNIHPFSTSGGGGSRPAVSRATTRQPLYGIPGTSYFYAYPIYVPMYDPSAYAQPAAAPDSSPAPAQPAPTIFVIYPPLAAPAVETAHPSMQVYEPEMAQPARETPTSDRFLFAFKDHSIYSAVAYWVDGDTLHYFTSGDTHKQVPLSMLDRDLTERLNQESGTKLKLPPAMNR